jgi:hypothetical protein
MGLAAIAREFVHSRPFPKGMRRFVSCNTLTGVLTGSPGFSSEFVSC